MLLQPARILRLVIAALVLAQVLETTGILDADGTGGIGISDAHQKLYAAWEQHAQPHWEDLTDNVQDWTSRVRHWCRAIRQTGTSLWSAATTTSTWSDPVWLSNSWWKEQVSPKYQTAVGLGIGMICAPLLVWTAAGEGLLKTGVAAYLVAEVVHQLLEESQFVFSLGGGAAAAGTEQDDVAEWELDIATTVRALLETWRQTVRGTVQSVRQGRGRGRGRDDDDDSGSYRFSFGKKPRRRDTGGQFPPHLRSGVIIGTVIGVLVGA
jgi:hypothetical protein